MDTTKPYFVITGPSAVGKTAITKGVLALGLPVAKVVTTTTRAPRADEVEGVSYHFVSRPEFESLISRDQMFEWAEYAGNFYGSQHRDVDGILAAGQSPLWVVDVTGADSLKSRYPSTYVIFLMPGAFDILRRRLEKRGMAENEIRRRLAIARDELVQAPRFDVRVINYDGQMPKIIDEVAGLIRRRIQAQ